MKRIVFSLVSVLMLSTFAWRCSKDSVSSSTDQTQLKSSLNTSVQAVGLAADAIIGTAGYRVLSLGAAPGSKSDTLNMVTITLDSLKGIYNYHPTVVPSGVNWIPPHKGPVRLFTKTASSTNFTILLPSQKVNSPGCLNRFLWSDTTLKNNFVIGVSDYYYHLNPFVSSTYRLATNVTVSDTAAGSVSILSNSTIKGFSYSASYSFGNGYTAQTQTISGDTLTTSNTILNGATVLFQEKVQRVRSYSPSIGEQVYILTIGNIQIKRIGRDSSQVYLNGVLQTKGKVTILDGVKANVHGRCSHQDNLTPGFGYNRDIQITFDDGTTTKLSQLAGNSVANVTAIFASLQQINFASNVVDWIAADIYFKKFH